MLVVEERRGEPRHHLMVGILFVENNYRYHIINQNSLLPKLLYSITSHPRLCPQILFPKQSCILGYINLLCWEKRKKGEKKRGKGESKKKTPKEERKKKENRAEERKRGRRNEREAGQRKP